MKIFLVHRTPCSLIHEKPEQKHKSRECESVPTWLGQSQLKKNKKTDIKKKGIKKKKKKKRKQILTRLHAEWPKFHRVLTILRAIGLRMADTEYSIFIVSLQELERAFVML